MPRKRYDDEFKTGAAKLVREQGYSVKKAAENLGVDLGSIRRWVREFGPAVIVARLRHFLLIQRVLRDDRTHGEEVLAQN